MNLVDFTFSFVFECLISHYYTYLKIIILKKNKDTKLKLKHLLGLNLLPLLPVLHTSTLHILILSASIHVARLVQWCALRVPDGRVIPKNV